MNEKKKKVPKWLLFIAIFLFICLIIGIVGGASGAKTNDSTSTSNKEEQTTQKSEYTISHGKLISAETNSIDGKTILVIKAKIESNLTNTLTIDQNYYNVGDLIKKQGCDKFDEIQYWAVADMTDGSESKVISFTLNSDTIKKIKDEIIVDNQIGNNADDLWILPSLKE